MTSSGTARDRRTTIVRGPGQKRAAGRARREASGDERSRVVDRRYVHDERIVRRTLLRAEQSEYGLAIEGCTPRPYTVSVGKATSPPRRRHAAARSMACGSGLAESTRSTSVITTGSLLVPHQGPMLKAECSKPNASMSLGIAHGHCRTILSPRMQLGLPFDSTTGTNKRSRNRSRLLRTPSRARRYVLRVDIDGRVRVTIPRGARGGRPTRSRRSMWSGSRATGAVAARGSPGGRALRPA